MDINKYLILILLIFFLILILILIHTSIDYKVIENTKYENLFLIKEYCPKMYLLDKFSNNDKLLDSLQYPYVFKPNYCESFSHQVEIIKNKKQAKLYIKTSIDRYIIAQKYHSGPYEATIYYSRHPISNKLKMYVVERKQNNTKTEWIWKSSIGHKHGYRTQRRKDIETKELKQKIIEISNNLPEFYLGRYDIRFESVEQLKHGKGFKILEINANDASDTRYSIDNLYFENVKIIAEWLHDHIIFFIINLTRGKTVDLKTFLYLTYKYFTKGSVCHQQDKIKNVFIKSYDSFKFW